MRAAPSLVLLASSLGILGGADAQAAPRPAKKAELEPSVANDTAAHGRPAGREAPRAQDDASGRAADRGSRDRHAAAGVSVDSSAVVTRAHSTAPRAHTTQTDVKQVAFQAGDDTTDRIDDNTHKDVTAPAPGREWQIQLGPYIWASSMSASVALGPLSTGVDVGFISLLQHTRYGAEFLGEVRHGRFSLAGDLMYGAADASGSTSVASVMMTLSGNVSSLLVDALAGYQVIGDDDSPFALEARSGIRYQHNAIRGELAVAGISVQTPELVDAASDLIAGARAIVRPTRALSLSGMVDIGVAGSSDSTWSASLDAGLRVSHRVLVSAGWRTLTTERSSVNVVLAGPRAAVQMVF